MSSVRSDLPKWLVESNQVVSCDGDQKTGVRMTGRVSIGRKADDTVLLVGDEVKCRLMQETLDREGVGKTRMFDANAKGGSGKQQLTDAEVEAAKTARIGK